MKHPLSVGIAPNNLSAVVDSERERRGGSGHINGREGPTPNEKAVVAIQSAPAGRRVVTIGADQIAP